MSADAHNDADPSSRSAGDDPFGRAYREVFGQDLPPTEPDRRPSSALDDEQRMIDRAIERRESNRLNRESD